MPKHKHEGMVDIRELGSRDFEIPDHVTAFVKLILPRNSRVTTPLDSKQERILARARFAAMDDNGDWFAYECEPEYDTTDGEWVPNPAEFSGYEVFYLGGTLVHKKGSGKETLTPLK